MISEAELRKQTIRQRIEQQRRNLPKEWIAARSAEIITRVTSLPEFQMARTVHTYVAWRSEVDNHALIKEMLQGDRRVVVPVVDLATRTLRHSQIEQFEDLASGTFGILEPPPERVQPVPISEIDLIIVPGIAFDRSGNRIGFGGGYYDDFLRQTRAVKIGLCFQFQVIDQIPTRVQDERVDILVTEKRVHDFRKKA
jgi:5-formyltetrahydrofolate cyclo-ligase